jgi:hypothetical protein
MHVTISMNLKYFNQPIGIPGNPVFLFSRSPVIGRPKSQPRTETAKKRKRLSSLFTDKEEETQPKRVPQPDLTASKDDSIVNEKAVPENLGDSINMDMFGDDEFPELLPPDRKVT